MQGDNVIDKFPQDSWTFSGFRNPLDAFRSSPCTTPPWKYVSVLMSSELRRSVLGVMLIQCDFTKFDSFYVEFIESGIDVEEIKNCSLCFCASDPNPSNTNRKYNYF